MSRKRRVYRYVVPALILCAGLLAGSFGATLDNPDLLRAGHMLSAMGLLAMLVVKLVNYSTRHHR